MIYLILLFTSVSVDVSINSVDAAYIKRVIRQRISAATHFLCLIGEETYLSDWVTWEIETAVELNKPIVAVKISNSNISPPAILNVGASWARSFTFDAIADAI